VEHLKASGHDTWTLLPEPAVRPRDGWLPDRPSVAGAAPRTRVLAVDDDRAFLDSLRTSLQFAGYEVYEATDGTAAIASAERLMPDAILLDIRMAGMDGYEVCRTLKANPATEAIPVIFITAIKGAMLYRWEAEAGATACLTKPFGIEALTSVLATVVAGAGCQGTAENATSPDMGAARERRETPVDALVRTTEPERTAMADEYRVSLSGEPTSAWIQALMDRTRQDREGRQLRLRAESGSLIFTCPWDDLALLQMRVALLDRLIAGASTGPGRS
jgi:CheY-like chemotaxis protein